MLLQVTVFFIGGWVIFQCVCVCMCMCVLSGFGCVWLFAALWTVGHQVLCPWDSPGENTGVGCHVLLQGIFMTQGSNPHLLRLLHCRWILYHWATGEAPCMCVCGCVYVYTHHIFIIRSSIERHLAGCFRALAIVNSAAVSTGVHVSFELEFSCFLDICPGMGLLDHMVTLVSVFEEAYMLFPIVAAPIYVPINSERGFLSVCSLSSICHL